eukprot:4541302-Pleurochrysis_carterae.AAC.1
MVLDFVRAGSGDSSADYTHERQRQRVEEQQQGKSASAPRAGSGGSSGERPAAGGGTVGFASRPALPEGKKREREGWTHDGQGRALAGRERGIGRTSRWLAACRRTMLGNVTNKSAE